MNIEKLGMTIEEMVEKEQAQATAAHVRAVTDYNIMMGILEDPSEEDIEDAEEEEDE